MSWADGKVYLDSPEEIYAYDTTLSGDGAPGKPGEERWCWAELASGTMVLQKRRLCRLLTLATAPKGVCLELASGSYYIADALAPAAMPLFRAAGFVSEKINSNAQGGVAQGVLPVGYWFWAVVRGPVDAISDAAIAADAAMIAQAADAAGQMDDTAVSTLEHCILGKSLELVAAHSTSFEMYCTIS